MSVGTPLCDADRAPWLARIAACIDGWREQGSVVVTCSALARAYHDIVVGGCDSVRLFHLVGSRDLIGAAVSCPRIFWTPICPTGGIHDEVEHEPNRNQRCE